MEEDFEELRGQQVASEALEPALFYLWDKEKLVGMCTTHVDDLLCAGEGKMYVESMAALKRAVDFDQDETLRFQHCGKMVCQSSDGTIEVTQEECAVNIKPIMIAPSRRRQKSEPCTAVEVTMLRGRYGSLSWLQRQTRPDLSFLSSSGQTAFAAPTVNDLVECNKAIAKAHLNAKRKVVFRGGYVDWDTAEIFLATDSSHANVDDAVVHFGADGEVDAVTLEPYRSQKGRVLGISTPMAEDGSMYVYTMDWKSQVEKRVCRSTLAAETYALASGVEAADWLRVLLIESRDVDFNIAEWADRTKDVKSRWFCDAKSVCDHLGKDVGCPQDKRIAIELASLKQLLNRGLGDELLWLDTALMPADPLTKELENEEVLFHLMESNKFTMNASEEVKQAKVRKAAKRTELKHEKKSVTMKQPVTIKIGEAGGEAGYE